ncbi:MAG: peptidoglycan DD-metalloendopeptidase family protein [Armatimonadota bacterium]|nr:peptidoglycan DD-metalloendopeptidase family protein [Armatimonadota bacterium]MDR7519845.1 peptidoglycan DD-metalloendopeptidase family protein [Armatimonadota bacterium]MDR7551242.1 peptidoglycan DD-metalloendopeptidase family protein [Armatimonadota bacterium]
MTGRLPAAVLSGGLAFLLAAPTGAWAIPAPRAGSAPAAASSLSARQEELRHLRRRLDVQRRRLEAARRSERRLSDEIQRLDRQREATERRLARLAADLRRVRQQAEGAAAAVARAESALAQRQTALAARLVDAHRYGRAGYLDVVLGATTFADFVARTRLVGAIVEEDARLIKAYEADREHAARWRRQLEERQAQMKALVVETEARQRVLAEQIEAKRDLLRRIVGERTATEQAVRELEEDSAALAALIQRLQPAGGGIGLRLAAFLWPLRGPLSSRFGFRVHPIFRRRHHHTGVDIAGPRGSPVRAAYDGAVIFAGWYGGYGKLVVLDHGQGISTLYGHLAEIVVAPGQRLARGQVLGRVGSTGYATGPHLHYEIRHNGRPIDPALQVR